MTARSRSPLPSIIAVLAVTAVGAVHLTAAYANTHDCQPPTCRGRGAASSACCQNLPCVIFAQLKSKMAAQEMYRDAALQARAKREAGGDGEAACKKLNELVDQAAASDGLRDLVQGDCSISSNDVPPALRTDKECNEYVMLPGRPENDPGLPYDNRNDAKQDRDVKGCSEFVDAAYDHEDYHRKQCKANRQSRLDPKVKQFADEEVNAYQQEIDTLKNQINTWRRSCADTEGAKQAEKDLDAAVKAMGSNDAKRKIKAATRTTVGGRR